VSGWRALDSGEEAAFTGSGVDAAPQQLVDAPSSKFDRILRFVDQHDLAGTCSAAASPSMFDMGSTVDAAAAAWHHSYDEEAEEGCGEALVAAAEALATGPACSVAFLYPQQQQQHAMAAAAMAAAATATTSASRAIVGSHAYFCAKPIDMSYDEEAEGCFEVSAFEAHAARATRLASFMERRAESRAASRTRRAGLRLSLGDLEAMQPWVDDAAARKAAAAVKRAAGRVPTGSYPHLAAFLAARTGGAMDAVESVIEALQRERGLQPRAPQTWQYTFDEEVHGALSSM